MLIRVKAKNLFSWEDLDFEVPRGITLIDGMNLDDQTPEGSGKSAIPNIACWIFFGKFPKDANIDEVIKFGEKSGGGAGYFDDGMTIIRTRKPNELYMRQGDKIIKGKDAKETQQLIQDYLGQTFESYCQSTYFAQNYDKKFLVSNQEDKGKILSEIQEISIFDKARKEVQDLAKIENEKLISLKNQINVEQIALDSTKSQSNLVQQFIDDKERQHSVYLTELVRKRDSALANLRQVQTKQDEVRARISQVDITASETSIEMHKVMFEQIQAELSGVVYARSQISNIKRAVSLKQQEGTHYANKYTTLHVKKSKLEAYILNPTKNCPTCGSQLADGDTSHAQKEVQDLDQEMALIVGSLKTIGDYIDANPLQSDQDLAFQEANHRQNLSVVDQHIKKAQASINDMRNLNNTVLMYDQEKTRSEAILQDCQRSIDNNKSPDLTNEFQKLVVLGETADQLNMKLAQITMHKVQTEQYLFQLESLKDGFKEIKSYIFSTALNELSFRANEFLTTLFQVPAQIKFKNEDMKIETEIHLNEKSMSIGLLSGGQFRRFSLATDLALSDMVSSRKSSKLNVLILDEYFKDLSETSMEKCLDLLKTRKSPVLLIEHNSIFKNIVDNTFYVELQGGTSGVSRQ